MNITQPINLTKSRLSRINEEFRSALSKTSDADLKKWGLESSKIFLVAIGRRSKNLIRLMFRLTKFIGKESFLLLKSSFKKEIHSHLKNRVESTKKVSVEFTKKTCRFCKAIAKALINNPREVAPQLFVGFIGFVIGSGGMDGDGGVPDMDIQLWGIGKHRSIFTHSIIAGSAIETVTISIILLIKIIHDKLPKQHDILWDNLRNQSESILKAISTGASLGIAYHLFVDSTIDVGKAYSDLPFSMPMEGHETFMGANAVGEALDVKTRNKEKDTN